MMMNIDISSRKQLGAVAIEFGLLVFLLMSLVFGITEFGRAIYQYNTIAKSVRDGVRLLSQAVPGDTAQIDAATCLVVYGNTGCTGAELVSGLKGNVKVKDAVSDPSTQKNQTVTGWGTANLVTVSVSGFGFKSLVTLVVPDITFNDISTTMIQP